MRVRADSTQDRSKRRLQDTTIVLGREQKHRSKGCYGTLDLTPLITLEERRFLVRVSMVGVEFTSREDARPMNRRRLKRCKI